MIKVEQYYRSKESRWGYRLLLKGVRHFGYYPRGQKVKHHQAQILMMDQVARSLALPKGARVLDAGCGEGKTAIHLAKKFDFRVVGIDLLAESIVRAKHHAKLANAGDAKFRVGSYMKLPYPDNSFDGIYTLETFVHAPDAKAALEEFRRVLKPKGRLVLFEYTITPLNEINDPKLRRSLESVIKGTSAPALANFTHGSFQQRLKAAGFDNVKVRDITKRVGPMLKWFRRMAFMPHKLIRLFGQEDRFANTTAGAVGVSLARRRYWKFVAVSATKR